MKEEHHPKGLNIEELKEWNELSKRLLELFNSIPRGTKIREIMSKCDEKGNSLIIVSDFNEASCQSLKWLIGGVRD